MTKDKAGIATERIPGLAVKRVGRPVTGKAMSAAERQRASRNARKQERFDTFKPFQISYLLSGQASQALSMLAYNSDKSQKQIIEELLILAYEAKKAQL